LRVKKQQQRKQNPPPKKTNAKSLRKESEHVNANEPYDRKCIN
jgi:hypothetical protein